MPLNLSEEEIEKRFQYSLRCEDASIIVDLRNQPQGDKEGRFNNFFAETEKYLSEVVGVACHERRHGEQLYLAKAVSFNDLHKRVRNVYQKALPFPLLNGCVTNSNL